MATELTITNKALANVPTVAELAELSYLDIRRDAVKYPRINTQPREAVISTLSAIIGQCTAFAGREISEENIGFMAINLYDLLMADEDRCGTKYLSLAEITKSLRKAVFGRAKNEMFGINVASIYRAITDYCLSEGQAASRLLQKEREQKAAEAFRRSSKGICIDSMCQKVAKARRADK